MTPDSFSDGGRYLTPELALRRGEALVREGADLVDVGGESTRPRGRTYGAGAVPVSEAEELARVIPVVEGLARAGIRVSIDTTKPGVARRALEAGARIVNDVSCGRDAALLQVVAEAGAGLVLMHSRGRGEVAGDNIRYRDVVGEVVAELERAVARAVELGVARERIWIDPGIGFAKTSQQSLRLLACTQVLAQLGRPLLVGPSRKSFIAEAAPDASGATPGPDAREPGTAAALTCAVLGGAAAVRVHDVRGAYQAVRLAEALRGQGACATAGHLCGPHDDHGESDDGERPRA